MADSCETPGNCSSTSLTVALVPCGSASMASRLSVLGAVPSGAKMLSRARSNVCVRSAVVGAGAAGAGAGVDGTSVRCGGVGAVGAGSGGVAAGAGCCGGVRGGAGLAGGAVTVMEGTGVVPGGEAGVPGGVCSAGCELGGVSPGVAGGAEGAGPPPDPGVAPGLGAGAARGSEPVREWAWAQPAAQLEEHLVDFAAAAKEPQSACSSARTATSCSEEANAFDD